MVIHKAREGVQVVLQGTNVYVYSTRCNDNWPYLMRANYEAENVTCKRCLKLGSEKFSFRP